MWPAPATFLVLATLIPLAAFVVLVFVGKRLGTPLAGWLGTAGIAASFVCSVLATVSWLNGGSYNGQEWGFEAKRPINIPIKWIPIGTDADPSGIEQVHKGFLDIGVYVDSLTIAMFGMITFVSTLIFIFSLGYMREDKRFPRFFTYLSLFCFSMLGLVLGGTILQLFVFWELVGLCSYLLIGFWYEKKSASNAAIKAFVTNRVGDFGFLIGFGILFYHVGNVTLPNLWQMLGGAGNGGAVMYQGEVLIGATLMTVIGVGLFFGAVGKSAQFPLHVWLPDAMEGPTPVSALIHAATMVAAGVYLVGRIFPILTPDAKLFIAIIGCTTLTMAALIALAQTDIKKVLAYSTLSQLGYMILAMGLGSWVGGLFHLITHAFFKALLFLGSGSVIHGAHHEQEMTQYGGLLRKMPVTAITFGIAVFAIAGAGFAGFGGFSGFYSKDLILANAGAVASMAEHSHLAWGYQLLFWMPTIIAYVTAFYMTRCWMLTFWGRPRNQHLYDHAHESPIMWGPLVVLALLSIIGGWDGMLGIRPLLQNAVVEAQTITGNKDLFINAWPSHEPHGPEADADTAFAHGWHKVHQYVAYAFIIGIGLGFLVYMNGFKVAGALMKIAPFNWIRIWLYRRMYFDELYFSVFVAITMALSTVSAWFDKYIVDGLVNLVARLTKDLSDAAGAHDKYVIDGAVNGVATLTQDLGAAVRAPQTGRIRMYVTMLIIAVTLGLTGAIIVVLSR